MAITKSELSEIRLVAGKILGSMSTIMHTEKEMNNNNTEPRWTFKQQMNDAYREYCTGIEDLMSLAARSNGEELINHPDLQPIVGVLASQTKSFDLFDRSNACALMRGFLAEYDAGTYSNSN